VTLTTGSAIAFGVSILASPITSRLFGPEEFGLAALFMSGATILGAIAFLRYEMAIVLPKRGNFSLGTRRRKSLRPNGETHRIHVYGRKWNLGPKRYQAVW
jgi:hypothetical protein